MIELTTENTKNAVERCKELKPKVRLVENRVYEVSSSRNQNIYTVRFDVQNGQRLAQCNCKASERGLVCYHIIGAATANTFHQAQKKGLVAWN